MTTIWTIIKKYATQLGLIYNAVGKTYNQVDTNYAGKLKTKWTIRSKS